MTAAHEHGGEHLTHAQLAREVLDLGPFAFAP
jgi:hypothetical protein